jgi:predicted DNA-binding transcriptional regulator YafY
MPRADTSTDTIIDPTTFRIHRLRTLLKLLRESRTIADLVARGEYIRDGCSGRRQVYRDLRNLQALGFRLERSVKYPVRYRLLDWQAPS